MRYRHCAASHCTERRMNRKTKHSEMSADELAKATAEFDREFVADTSGKPGPEARRRWLRAKRKRGPRNQRPDR
jgi:hypothetical protein